MTCPVEAVWRLLEARRLTGALLRAGADLALAENCVRRHAQFALEWGMIGTTAYIR